MLTLPIGNKRQTKAALVLAFVCLAGPAFAADKSSQPVNIQSNSASFDQGSGHSVYKGSVELTRGGLTLTGNKLVLTNTRKRGQLHAVLTGTPARIDKQPDQAGKNIINGHAKTITFDKPDQQVIMDGDAYLERADGNSVRGQTIVHNVETGRSHAERGGNDHKRVKVTLKPGSDTSDEAP